MKFETKYNHGDNVKHTVSGQKGIITSLSVLANKSIRYEVSSGIGCSNWIDEVEIKHDNSKPIKIGD